MYKSILEDTDWDNVPDEYLTAAQVMANPPKFPTLKKTEETENPKDIVAGNKIPVHLFPAAAVYMGALGNLDGALKYGRNNWRTIPIKYTEYLTAIKRHCDALLEGENQDPDSGLHHLCHILAGAGIIADAMGNNTLLDDRNYTPKSFWREFINELTPHVARLKEKHKDKNPKHYTIEDNE